MRSELHTIDHVLRGALNTALLNLQLLSTSLAGDAPARPLLERASAELRRMATELLPAALRIATLEVQELQRVDLAKVVDRLRTDHGLGNVSAGCGEDLSVVADPTLVATAATHLLANAVAATPPGAPAPDIAAEPAEGGGATLVVSNACASPAPLTPDGLPASRGHLGGLAMVVRIARLHDGALTYENRDGHIIARLSLPPAPRRAMGEVAPDLTPSM